MTINDKKFVSLTYELREENAKNTIIEEVKEDNPLNFVVGIGKMLPMFENNLYNLKQGDDFEFLLNSANAYGEYNDKMIADVPLEIFMKDGKIDENLLKIGNIVPMKTKDGNVLEGIIKSITEQTVNMDFNHPLAGKNLIFSGKILEVRESTKEETTEHNHVCTGCGKHEH